MNTNNETNFNENGTNLFNTMSPFEGKPNHMFSTLQAEKPLNKSSRPKASIDMPIFEKFPPPCSAIATRHHFVKNISCSKHQEEEAVAPGEDEFLEC